MATAFATEPQQKKKRPPLRSAAQDVTGPEPATAVEEMSREAGVPAYLQPTGPAGTPEQPPDTGTALRRANENAKAVEGADRPEFTRAVETVPTRIESRAKAPARLREGKPEKEKPEQDGKELKEKSKLPARLKAPGELEEAKGPLRQNEPEGEDEDTKGDFGAEGDDLGVAAAFGDRETSLALLSEAAASATDVASMPVSFAPGQDETESDVNRRAGSDTLATGFLAQNASQVATVANLGFSVPTRIQSSADATKAAIDQAVEENRTAVREKAKAAKKQARGAAAGARQRIVSQHTQTVSSIRVATTTARVTVEVSYVPALLLLTLQHANQLTKLTNIYADADRKYKDAGSAAGSEASAKATSRAVTWLAQRNGESSILDGPIHDNRLEARAEAAQQVGAAYKQGLIDDSKMQAEEAQKGKQQDLTNIGTQVQEARTALDGFRTDSLKALTDAEEQAILAADQAKDRLLGAVNTALAGALAGLTQQEAQELEKLAQFGERQKLVVDRDSARSTAAMTNAISQESMSLAGTLRQLALGAPETEAPEPGALGEVLAEAQSDFDGLVQPATMRIEEGITKSETTLMDAGAEVVAGLAQLAGMAMEKLGAAADAFGTGAAGIASNAVKTFTGMRTSHSKGASATSTAARTGFDAITKGIDKLFKAIATNLEGNFTTSTTGLLKGYRDYLKQKLDAEINCHADEAAAKVQPRWKTVAKILLAVVVIVVVALVVGPAVIGAVGAAAGALGAGAATAGAIGTIVGGAIVGAAAGATIQIGNNLIDGERSFSGIFKGVGDAAITGAIGGALGGAASLLGKAAMGLASSGLGKFALDTGINVLGDLAGGVLGDLATKGTVDWTGVLVGAGIGLGVGAAAGNLGKLPKIGKIAQGIQSKFSGVGEKFGKSAGGKVAGALGIEPKIDVTAPTVKPPVAKPEPVKPEVDVAAPKVPTPEPPKVKAPETPPVKPAAEVQPPKTAPEPPAPKAPQPDPKPPKLAEAPGPKAKAPETGPTKPVDSAPAKPVEPEPRPAAHPDEPEIEEGGVVAKHPTPDGHEIKVLKDGSIARCSDCAKLRTEYEAELNDPKNAKLKERLNEIEGFKKPGNKAKAAAELETKLKKARAEATAEEYRQGKPYEDPKLEKQYQEYLDKKVKRGETPRDRTDYKEALEHFGGTDSPIARGNRFNEKVNSEDLYPAKELNLIDGKRLDGYDHIKGEIVSRKAVDFDMLDEGSFGRYLDEFGVKYPRGKLIRSNAYPQLDGKALRGKYILEVPASNKAMPEAARFEALAAAKGVEIRYTPE